MKSLMRVRRDRCSVWIESEEVRSHARAVVEFDQAFGSQAGSFAQSTLCLCVGLGTWGALESERGKGREVGNKHFSYCS